MVLASRSPAHEMLPWESEPRFQNLERVYDVEQGHCWKQCADPGCFSRAVPLKSPHRKPPPWGCRWGWASRLQPGSRQVLTDGEQGEGRPPSTPHLQLGGAAFTAHGVATGAEGRVDLLLTAHHAQHGLLQLAQLLLQRPGLLAAEALTAGAVQAALRGLKRGAGRAVLASRHEVHNAGIVQSPPGMVIHLL